MFRLIVLAFVFVSGVGGNLISQSMRGIGNLIKSVFCFAAGLLLTLISCMQWLGGGGKEAERTFFAAKKNLAIAFSGLFSGLLQLMFGLTFISPMLRGSQIVSESFAINGVYAPAGRNRTQFQNLFGLNSWRSESLVKPLRKFENPRQIQEPVFIQTSNTKQTQERVFVDISKSKTREKAPDTNLKKLVMSYKMSRVDFRSGMRRGEILASIALQYPKYYHTQIDKSWKKKTRSARKV